MDKKHKKITEPMIVFSIFCSALTLMINPKKYSVIKTEYFYYWWSWGGLQSHKNVRWTFFAGKHQLLLASDEPTGDESEQ